MRPLGFPGEWKIAISVAPGVKILIRTKNLTFEDHKTKTIWNIFHVVSTDLEKLENLEKSMNLK